MFKRSDFIVTAFTKIVYIGSDYTFERHKNLTKFDIACVLEHRNYCKGYFWTTYFDSFSKRELIEFFLESFENEK